MGPATVPVLYFATETLSIFMRQHISHFLDLDLRHCFLAPQRRRKTCRVPLYDGLCAHAACAASQSRRGKLQVAQRRGGAILEAVQGEARGGAARTTIPSLNADADAGCSLTPGGLTPGGGGGGDGNAAAALQCCPAVLGLHKILRSHRLPPLLADFALPLRRHFWDPLADLQLAYQQGRQNHLEIQGDCS